jgi:FAD/FMN-containing dehydrogenase
MPGPGGGTIARPQQARDRAEHGIGLEKKLTLRRLGSSERLAMMRKVKALFDPNGIMNPGKVL